MGRPHRPDDAEGPVVRGRSGVARWRGRRRRNAPNENELRSWTTQQMKTISINRAPVLTLWAAVVAERLGFDEDEALSLGKALAGLTAQSKGRRLGIYKAHEEGAKQARQKERGEEFWIEVCGRPVPAKNTEEGVRAVQGTQLIDPG